MVAPIASNQLLRSYQSPRLRRMNNKKKSHKIEKYFGLGDAKKNVEN